MREMKDIHKPVPLGNTWVIEQRRGKRHPLPPQLNSASASRRFDLAKLDHRIGIGPFARGHPRSLPPLAPAGHAVSA